jgi:deoxycytidylate deaminase
MRMELATLETQTCRTCGETKPITEFDTRADTGKRKTQCKDCRRKYQNERNGRLHQRQPKPARVAGTSELLVCTRCHELKPADAFPRRRRGEDLLQHWCRDCFAEINALYYAENRDREIARIQRNKERARKAARDLVDAYLATHPCVDCGESDPVVLEFDHVREKRMDISLMVAGGYPCHLIEAEIAKCEVRCGNDHRRKTEERRRAGAQLAEARGPCPQAA